MKLVLHSFRLSALAALCLITACSTISTFDQAAYEHATSAKVDTLALMDKATGNYGDYQKDIDTVTTVLKKAYEYDIGRPKNSITAAQWKILLDPDRNLVGGFLKMWKNKGSLNQTFVTEKKKQIGDAFDQIIGLESGKLKPTKQ